MSAKLQAKFDEAYAQHERGHLDRAEAGYKTVLKQLPDHAPSLYLLGLIAHAKKQYKQAIAYYRQVLDITPADADAYFEMANSQHAMGLYAEALVTIEKAIRLDPNNPDYYCNRGLILRMLERFTEAVASYDQGLALNPEDIDLWYNKGNALRALHEENEALKCYLQVWQRKPDHFDAWNNSGLALLEVRQYQAALNAFEKAIGLKPEEAKFYWGAATALDQLNEPEAALAFYRKVLKLTTDPALKMSATEGEALVLLSLARNAEAEVALRNVCALKQVSSPSTEEFNLSLALLAQGKFAEGWMRYESRMKAEQKANHQYWDGISELRGKRVLLRQEQGLGDMIQFCRYALLFIGLGARVVLETPRTLAELFASLGEGVEICIQGQALPEADYSFPLLSSPFLLRTDLASIPANTPYLHAGVARRQWLSPASKKKKIGLVWSGNLQFTNDHKRSVPFELVASMVARVPDAEFYCIQKEIREYERESVIQSGITMLGETFTDFSDTASAIEQLDLVISVDTSLAHLAGALNKPVWILLPYAADWRWMSGRDDSPWYPSARLFRQTRAGDWAGVLEDISSELQK